MDSNDKVKVRSVAVNRQDVTIASLAALAIIIHIAETVVPSPLPGIKPGLANVVTVVTLCLFGRRMACWVSLLRVVVGSLLLGTFLGPPFFLSMSGALASLGVLLLISKWNECCTGLMMGAMGMSTLAALAHMLAQFYVAYLLFVPHPGIFSLLPILLSAAMLFGLLTGAVAQSVLLNINRKTSKK